MAKPEIIIQIDEPFLGDVQTDQISQALTLTFQRYSQIDTLTINIVVTSAETVQHLNHQYRGLNTPTDVLSFENIPDPDFPGFEQDYLGDVIIAYPVAETQARASGHTTMEEIILLAVHGALHLLGFDHETPTNREKMWAAQNKIMAKLGLAHIQSTET